MQEIFDCIDEFEESINGNIPKPWSDSFNKIINLSQTDYTTNWDGTTYDSDDLYLDESCDETMP